MAIQLIHFYTTDSLQRLYWEMTAQRRKPELLELIAKPLHQTEQVGSYAITHMSVDRQSPLGCCDRGQRRRAAMLSRRTRSFKRRNHWAAARHNRERRAEPLR